MNYTLPLFYYPTTCIYVDDDKNLLKTLGDRISHNIKIKLFDNSKECLNFLSNCSFPLEKYSFLKPRIADENYGLLKWTPMDFDITQLAKLVDDKNRYDQISVIIIDYNMPEMDGFALAKEIQKLEIQKILLTGNIQETKAIEGFNKNLIQRFLQKGSEKMVDKLFNYIKELSNHYFSSITFPLLKYLESEEKLPLSDPTFIDFFETYLEKNNISEYYLIDKEGSFLCVDKNRKQSCIVVRSSRSIDAWLSIYDTHNALSKLDIEKLKNHQILPFFGVGKECWHTNSSTWSQYLYETQIVEGREKYLISEVNLS